MPSLESVLAGLPGIGGYEASRQRNEQRDLSQLHQMGALQKILARQIAMQREQQLYGILSSDMPMEQKQRALMQIPGGLDIFHKALGVQKDQAALAQSGREAAVFAPENIARNTIPGTPAITAPADELGGGPGAPAVASRVNLDALRRQAAMTGVKGLEAYSTHQALEEQRRASLAATEYARAESLASREDQAQQSRDLRRDIAANRPDTPVQTHTDEKGMLWEKPRGRGWQPALGPDGKQLGGRVPTNPAAEQIYRDYANHPQVKEASELEAKMKPLVDYMIAFKKTGASVNANDAALAKAYLAVTTSLGNRAYTLDQKQLAALPNLGDRIGNMASSFFAGKDLTDQTRTEMFDYIVQRYKALDAARQEHKTMTTRRGAARGVTPEQIFGTQD